MSVRGAMCCAPCAGAAVAAMRQVERRVAGRAAQIVVLSEFMRSQLAAPRPNPAPSAPSWYPAASTRAGSPRDARAAVRTIRRVLFTRVGSPARTRCRRADQGDAVDHRIVPGTTLKIAGTAGCSRPRGAGRQLGVRNHVDFLGRVKDDELTAGTGARHWSCSRRRSSRARLDHG